MSRRFLGLTVGLAWLALASLAQGNDSKTLCGEDAQPCLSYGARVFQERCALCHGSDGLGEGILPLSMHEYPNTNLLDPKHGSDEESVRDIILHGNTVDGIGDEMPPWGDELTHTQVESVTRFVQHMRSDLESAINLLRSEAARIEPSFRIGRAVYAGRCALCHGPNGEGDGKMSAIIKNPPPFNLTLSGAPDDYLRRIITGGGAKLGRSPRMPPWGGDLTGAEIESVMLYIKSLRNY